MALLGALAPMGHGMARRRRVALQMHADHGVPLVLGHIGEAAVAQDAGIVHEHMQVAEAADRELDQLGGLPPVADIMTADFGLAAAGDDLLCHMLGRCQIGAIALQISAEVVDDNAGAGGGECQRMGAPETAAGAGDDGDTSVEAAHHCPPCTGSNTGNGGAPARSRQVTRTVSPILHSPPTILVTRRGPSSSSTTATT